MTLAGGSHLSGLKPTGDRELRGSPAAIHDDPEEGKGMRRLTGLSRVDWWWKEAKASTTSTGSSFPVAAASGEDGSHRRDDLTPNWSGG